MKSYTVLHILWNPQSAKLEGGDFETGVVGVEQIERLLSPTGRSSRDLRLRVYLFLCHDSHFASATRELGLQDTLDGIARQERFRATTSQ